MGNRVYLFKIVMKGISPVIWRRIIVPESYNFWDLHVVIQDAMGWVDYHLHLFRFRRKHFNFRLKTGRFTFIRDSILEAAQAKILNFTEPHSLELSPAFLRSRIQIL